MFTPLKKAIILCKECFSNLYYLLWFNHYKKVELINENIFLVKPFKFFKDENGQIKCLRAINGEEFPQLL